MDLRPMLFIGWQEFLDGKKLLYDSNAQIGKYPVMTKNEPVSFCRINDIIFYTHVLKGENIIWTENILNGRSLKSSTN